MNKYLFIALFFIFTFSVGAQTQTKEETICIPLSTAQKANKAFDEVKESRPLIAQLLQDKADLMDQVSQAKIEIAQDKVTIKGHEDKEAEMQKKYTLLEAQKCSTTSFIFGLIKIKKC